MADEGFDILERRRLDDEDTGETWQIVYVSFVLVYIFGVLMAERAAPDSAMLTGLTLVMAAEIVTIKEGVAGFSNEGVLTVMALFIVANGVTVTGALDWYMGKLLGRPKTVSSAQLRMMVPCCLISCFLNNTPIVAVMIPIVLRWGKNIRVAPQQLLILLAFSVVLGGTCTLIGTSTNLVVSGLYEKKYPDLPAIGIFELGQYGVPIAMVGIAYMLFAAPYLLPNFKSGGVDDDGSSGLDTGEDILLGARLTQWSPAAGRSVKRSGLRDTGGIYLVSVHRAATGNVHRAVGPDFVLNIGDLLYFTGLVEEFGSFCEEHGLEIITNEVDVSNTIGSTDKGGVSASASAADDDFFALDEEDRTRRINGFTDLIRDYSSKNPSIPLGVELEASAPPEVFVTSDDRESHRLIVVGINAPDRAGLLLDISKGIGRLNLQVHHSEALVVETRSLSVWRCEFEEGKAPDLEEVWTVLNALLATEKGILAVKKRGLKILRATVTRQSRLVGQVLGETNFRNRYRAAIVAVQHHGQNVTEALSTVTLHAGDVLVLQATDDSPLLTPPPEDFYHAKTSTPMGQSTRKELVESPSKNLSNSDEESSDLEHGVDVEGNEAVWNDLHVIPTEGPTREYLVAYQVRKKAAFIGKDIQQAGLTKFPTVFIVSIERPALASRTDGAGKEVPAFTTISPDDSLQGGDVLWFAGPAGALGDLRKIPGLALFENKEVKKMQEKVYDRRLIQAVVSNHAPLVGKTVKEYKFRTRYGAAVIAVHRDGLRIHDHPGNIKLHAGDVLLLEAGPTFLARSGVDKDRSFVLLAEVENSSPPRLKFVIPVIILVTTMIVLNVLEILSLLIGALLVAIVMVTMGLMSEQEARESVHWNVYIAVASAFGIGTALSNSGFASGVAKLLVELGHSIGIGDAGIIGAVYLATILICNIVTHNAAAALIFPIAIGAAEEGGVDPLLMSFVVMLGASANWVSPFAYQCNLMVFQPGQYTTKDFVKFGIPMQIVLWIVSVAVLSGGNSFPWFASWVIAALILFLVSFLRLTNCVGLTKVLGSREKKSSSLES